MVDKKILIIAAIVVVVVIVASIVVLALALGIGLGVGLNDSSSGSSSNSYSSGPPSSPYEGGLSATCPGASGTPSNPPVQVGFLRNVNAGETGWFASPIVADLDNDGVKELVAAYYSLFVYDNNYVLLDKADTSGPRVFPPHIVANIDNSGPVEVCIGQGENVICYNLVSKKLVAKWTSASIGSGFEIRGMACADLTGGGGSKQIVVTTTRTDGTSIFVFDGATGNAYAGWPRYNTGSDTTVNGFGNSGYGEYGINVGIGNINADSNLEIITTFDNHQIQAFRADGTSINASSYYTYPWSGPYFGNRMTWGQFIRWYNADDEAGLYNTHTSTPVVEKNPWMQWTQSPPGVADLDLDGKSEVFGVSNIETAPNGPYETQYWALAVFNGDYGDTGATRKSGWEVFPRGGSPVQVNGDYPPTGIPAPAIANILGDPKLEIIVTLNDGNVYCFDYNGTRLWNYNFKNGINIIYSTEPAIADLNNDGSPEIIFATFGSPGVDSGYLNILSADGRLMNSFKIDTQGNNNGNGNGIPAPPTVADLDGDGTLEIFLQSFEHGMDVYHVNGSTTNCVVWGTSRGNYERTGAPS